MRALLAPAVGLLFVACQSTPNMAPRDFAADLLVQNALVVTVDADFRILPNGAVAVKDGQIVAVGAARDIATRFPVGTVRESVDAHGAILMPGLVNAHQHAAMTPLRGGADDLELHRWLTEFIFPAEAKNVTADLVRDATLLACLEMIAGGTTTFADMYYFEDEVAKAVDRSGMRGVLGETIIDFPVPDAPDPDRGLAAARAFIERWKHHPRVVPAIAPHAPYTVSPAVFEKVRALAAESGAPILVHLAETAKEDADVRQRYARSPVEHLAALGILGPQTHAAHCVVLSDSDVALLAKTGTSCAHNPESNMKLASGAAPVAKLLAAGVPVGLGTDGPASNNDLDMFEAMDFASKLAKLSTGDPTSLPARQVVEMATRRGARAVGLDDRIGSLEPGKRADMILVRIDRPHATPMWSAASHLVSVLGAADVSRVWVDGRELYRDGQFLTLDEAAIRSRANALRDRVRASLETAP